MTAQRYSIHLWVIPGPFPQTPTAPIVAISVHLKSSSSFPSASSQLLHLCTCNTRHPCSQQEKGSESNPSSSETCFLSWHPGILQPYFCWILESGCSHPLLLLFSKGQKPDWLLTMNAFNSLTPPDFPSLEDFNGFSHLYGLALQIH